MSERMKSRNRTPPNPPYVKPDATWSVEELLDEIDRIRGIRLALSVFLVAVLIVLVICAIAAHQTL